MSRLEKRYRRGGGKTIPVNKPHGNSLGQNGRNVGGLGKPNYGIGRARPKDVGGSSKTNDSKGTGVGWTIGPIKQVGREKGEETPVRALLKQLNRRTSLS